jgi:4-diphosphocytidyl-2-C-methyl-D-erythritol kinase
MSIEPASRFKVRKACAKINLTLEVIGKRDDGYHQIASVMQAVDLCDTLSFQPGEHFYLDCNIATLVSPNNLVFRAAKLLQDFTGKNKGAAISINKTIPLASGLGGGSSDAAATLQALNEVWELNLTLDNLGEIASNLGSDIFFFLHGGGTALIEGRGDKVTPLPSLPKTWVVLMKPPIDVPNKTSGMYASLVTSHFTHGEATQRMIKQLELRERITPYACYNVFESVAFSRFAVLEEYRRRFLSAGAGEVHLAGSGPTLFALVEDEAQGKEICHKLEKERIEVYLAKTL